MSLNNSGLQLNLPLELISKELKNHVKQHWNVTFSNQGKISVCAKKIMAVVLAQIKDNENQLKPFYVVHVNEVCRETNTTEKYQEMRRAFDDLMGAYWKFENIESDEIEPYHLLDTTKHKGRDGFSTNYKNGYLTIALNPNLQDFFVKIAHYSTWELENYMKLTNWYSMRFFEILSAFRDTGFWRVPISELKGMLDCQTKHKRTSDFIERVITPVQEELEKTNLAFTFVATGDDRFVNRGRPQLMWLEFTLKKVERKTIPAKWYEGTEEERAILTILTSEFQIKESHIVRYIKAIGKEESIKLIRTWRNKGKAIVDKAKYCNSVWCKIGKAKLEEKKKAQISN